MARQQVKESTALLKGNTTKAGRPKDLLNDEYIMAFAFSDTEGTLKIEQSPDKTAWYTIDKVDVDSNNPTTLVSELHLRWARIKYENANQPQSDFALYSCIKG